MVRDLIQYAAESQRERFEGVWEHSDYLSQIGVVCGSLPVRQVYMEQANAQGHHRLKLGKARLEMEQVMEGLWQDRQHRMQCLA